MKVQSCSMTKSFSRRLGDYMLYTEVSNLKIIDVQIELLKDGCHSPNQPPQTMDTLLQIFLDDRKGFSDWLDELYSEVVRMDTEILQARSNQ